MNQTQERQYLKDIHNISNTLLHMDRILTGWFKSRTAEKENVKEKNDGGGRLSMTPETGELTSV